MRTRRLATPLLLASRLGLFALAQAALALAFALAGLEAPWTRAAGLWLFTAAAANAVSLIVLLRSLGGAERLRELLRVRRETLRQHLKWLLPLVLLAGPVAWLPNLALAHVLWLDPDTGSRIILQPLGAWAAVAAALLFTPLHALTELPTYFFAAAPALDREGHTRLTSTLLAAFFLAAQHIALPLVFDARYALWRAGMFLPFAIAIGLVLRARPTLLPYVVVLHVVMDAQLPLLAALVGSGVMPL